MPFIARILKENHKIIPENSKYRRIYVMLDEHNHALTYCTRLESSDDYYLESNTLKEARLFARKDL